MAHPPTRTVEVERKRQLSDDGTSLAPLLARLGYQADAPVVEVDTYYSRPDIDFMQTVECLRVRRRGEFAEITYKPASTAATHAADHVVSKVETNVTLHGGDQVDAARQLLANLGMVELVRVEKTRTSYRHPGLPGVSVSIDAIRGVGAFVETEVNRPTAAGAADLVAQIEHALGLQDLPAVALPYRDLVLNAANGQPAPARAR